MTRDEWKRFHHSIRADVRAFRSQHGGLPCFLRRLTHKGEEWSFTRRQDTPGRSISTLRKSIIRLRAWRGLSAGALDECRMYRVELRRSYKPRDVTRQAIRSAIEEARRWRLSRGTDLGCGRTEETGSPVSLPQMECRKCGAANPLVYLAPVVIDTVGSCICMDCAQARGWLDRDGALRPDVTL